MNKTVFTKLGFVRTALAVGVGIPFFISSAFAQDQASAPPITDQAIAPVTATGNQANPAAEGAATTERIVVTGSYIPTAETESALPVTVYTAEVLTKQGANTPAEGLRELPSFVGGTAGQSENDANGGDGSAFINLRALGPGNTLTLINGRRAFAFSDINQIPLGGLARTEVLRDGASAIYGSDAVAGVVNFVMLDGPGEAPYQGAEVFALYGNTTDHDAHVRQVYVRAGVVGLDGKLSIAAAAEYYSRAALFSHDRDIARTADARASSDGPTALDPYGPLNLGGYFPQSSLFPGSVQAFNQPGSSLRILIDPTSVPVGPQSYRSNQGVLSSDRFNFNQFTSSIPAQEKYETYVTGRYKIFGDGLQIYGDMLYSKRKQDNQIAPAPFALFFGPRTDDNGQFTGFDFQTSPFNPFGQDLSNVRYRLIKELGNRVTFNDFDSYRYTAGLSGTFNIQDNSFISFLGYDTGFVYERGDQNIINLGDAVVAPLDQEIEAGNFNPFIGIQAPLSGFAPTFNADGTPTGNTAFYDNVAAAQRASYIGRSFFGTKDFLADIKVFGNLFPSLYQGGIGFNLGYEYRHNRTKFAPDPRQAASTGTVPQFFPAGVLGFNANAPFSYHQEVNSYFGELQVPLVVSSMNIPGVRSLDASVAYRYEEFDDKDQFTKLTSSFNNGGNVRVSVRYQPVEDITIRGSYGQAFSSPGLGALFSPVLQNFPLLFDPLSQQNLQPVNGVQQGGNTALKPEESDSYTAGLVLTPRFLRGFTLTADVYQVYTTNLILGAADFAQLALTQNGAFLLSNPGQFAAAPFSNLITRNTQAPFEVTSINSVTQNAGKRLVNGLDVEAVYQIPTQNFGTLTLSAGYNYFFTWKAEPVAGAGTHSFLGDYNAQTIPLAPGGIPYHKGFLRGEHEWKGFDLTLTLNYISSLNDDSFNVYEVGGVLVDNPTGTASDPQFNVYRTITDYITLDGQLSYTFPRPAPVEAAPEPGYSKDAKDGKGVVQQTATTTAAPSANLLQRLLWDTTLTVGVNNAFDRRPPSVLGAFNDNYDTSNYTIRNRYYYVSIKKKF